MLRFTGENCVAVYKRLTLVTDYNSYSQYIIFLYPPWL